MAAQAPELADWALRTLRSLTLDGVRQELWALGFETTFDRRLIGRGSS